MVFGPLMDKIDVVLQRVDITAVIEWHEQHNVIGIQVEFGIGQERDLGDGIHENDEEQGKALIWSLGVLQM